VSTVLVVEDDELIATALRRELTKAGHTPAHAGTIQDALGALAGCDLVLCDLGLPDGDGLDLISHIREQWPALPVIAVTARAEQVDVLQGLGLGAVDYVVKPFALAELLARVNAQLRQARAAAGARHRSRLLSVGDITIDVASRQVRAGDHELALRPKEFDLLVRLARGRGAVVLRDDLMRDVWGEGWWGPTKTLDVHINGLRSKLGDRAGRLVTVRGVGYRLDPSAER
jgi:DNA-binding response OmpR family regulator